MHIKKALSHRTSKQALKNGNSPKLLNNMIVYSQVLSSTSIWRIEDFPSIRVIKAALLWRRDSQLSHVGRTRIGRKEREGTFQWLLSYVLQNPKVLSSECLGVSCPGGYRRIGGCVGMLWVPNLSLIWAVPFILLINWGSEKDFIRKMGSDGFENIWKSQYHCKKCL